MRECKNINQAIELVKRYKSITDEEITESLNKRIKDNEFDEFSSAFLMNRLTGFGFTKTCKLCVDVNCSDCIHTVVSGKCCSARKSYMRLFFRSRDTSLEDVKNGIKERANYLNKLVKMYENGGNYEIS